MQMVIPECYDSLNDALRAAVMALGGFKKVGATMRPDFDRSDDWLRHCLDTAKREHLTPEQTLWLLREAKLAGWHSSMDYFASSAGYKVEPLNLETAAQELQEGIAATLQSVARQQKELEGLLKRMAGGKAL